MKGNLMRCDMCNGSGDIKNENGNQVNCPKCDGQGRYDENNCRKPLDRYGITRYCDRPKGHEGSCMTWNEYVNSIDDNSDVVIPAGD